MQEAMKDVSRTKIRSLLADRDYEYGSTYHGEVIDNEDCLNDARMYINLGEDPESAVDDALADLLRKASENGLSTKGSKRL